MSQMQSLTNGPLGDENQDEVYVIFRVYNLGKVNTAVMVYVDPEEHRRQEGCYSRLTSGLLFPLEHRIRLRQTTYLLSLYHIVQEIAQVRGEDRYLR